MYIKTMQLDFYLPTFSTPYMDHFLYLIFRCDFDVMESLEEFEGSEHSCGWTWWRARVSLDCQSYCTSRCHQRLDKSRQASAECPTSRFREDTALAANMQSHRHLLPPDCLLWFDTSAWLGMAKWRWSAISFSSSIFQAPTQVPAALLVWQFFDPNPLGISSTDD